MANLQEIAETGKNYCKDLSLKDIAARVRSYAKTNHPSFKEMKYRVRQYGPGKFRTISERLTLEEANNLLLELTREEANAYVPNWGLAVAWSSRGCQALPDSLTAYTTAEGRRGYTYDSYTVEVVDMLQLPQLPRDGEGRVRKELGGHPLAFVGGCDGENFSVDYAGFLSQEDRRHYPRTWDQAVPAGELGGEWWWEIRHRFGERLAATVMSGTVYVSRKASIPNWGETGLVVFDF